MIGSEAMAMGIEVTATFVRQALERQGLTLSPEDVEALTPGVANLLTMFETFDELELGTVSPDVVTIFPE